MFLDFFSTVLQLRYYSVFSVIMSHKLWNNESINDSINVSLTRPESTGLTTTALSISLFTHFFETKHAVPTSNFQVPSSPYHTTQPPTLTAAAASPSLHLHPHSVIDVRCLPAWHASVEACAALDAHALGALARARASPLSPVHSSSRCLLLSASARDRAGIQLCIYHYARMKCQPV